MKNGDLKKVGIKDIASMAGISIGTVDRVLHNRGEVKDETRKLVMKIVEELEYKPNLLAKSLASKKQLRIAVLIPEKEVLPYWEEPAKGILRAAEEIADFNTEVKIFSFNTIDSKMFCNQFSNAMEWEPSGMVIAPTIQDSAYSCFDECRKKQIPYLYIDSNLEDELTLGYFGQNAVQSGRVAAKLMHFGIDDGSKIIILKTANRSAITHHLKRREEGFLTYFADLQSDTEILSYEIDLSDCDEPDASLHRIFAQNQDIKGVFVTNSRVYKVAKFLKDSQYQKVVLIGYDLVQENIQFLEDGMIDFLICQKPEEQGYKGVMGMFNYLMANKPVERMNYSPIDIIMKENLNYYKTLNEFK